jgi:HEAT repeat protein
MRSPMAGFSLAAAGVLAALGLSAQGTLRTRIEGGGDGRVQFRFAARNDVCGLGQSIQVGRSYSVSAGAGFGDGFDRTCRRGPVVVRITRTGGQVVGVEVEIAPESSPEGVNDLGSVRSQEASEYLLDLAERAEGRPAREAIFPAVLADSATVWPGLLALSRNRELSRSVRQSALSWLGRELDRISAEDGRRVSAALVTLASDPEETSAVRQQAVSLLARNQRADLGALTRMATGSDPWLRDAAIQAMATSGDPRARDFLRAALGDASLPDKVRVTVIRGLGGQYATGKDVELLRARYASLTSLETRRAVLQTVAEQGGNANLQWLLRIAADPNAPPELRGQAAESAQRAGASSAQLATLYDQSPDRRGKEAAINALFRNGDRAGVDALVKIARNETDPSVRRALISRLGRLDDERVRALLKELTENRD